MKYYKIATKDYYEDRIASYADFTKNTRSLGFTQSKSKRLVFNATVSAELYSVPTKTRK
ncbi:MULTISPECIES: hypothetical protein [Flavobacterium]|uniref:Uncharacterized protein n=1 Tax=Flavobacterium covae TaxID=2906076 RepID=A0ABW8PJV9_9FLAO|nr:MULTISPECIES: hypothetical protein [Flavobacterium]